MIYGKYFFHINTVSEGGTTTGAIGVFAFCFTCFAKLVWFEAEGKSFPACFNLKDHPFHPIALPLEVFKCQL